MFCFNHHIFQEERTNSVTESLVREWPWKNIHSLTHSIIQRLFIEINCLSSPKLGAEGALVKCTALESWGPGLKSRVQPCASCVTRASDSTSPDLWFVICQWRIMVVATTQAARRVNRLTCVNKCSICVSYKMMVKSVLKTGK